MDGPLFSVGDVIGSFIALGSAFGWIEWRLRGVGEKMDATENSLITTRETAINKEREERILSDRAITAEHQAATAKLERQIAQTSRDIAEMKLATLRDLREYPTRNELQVLILDRLDKIEQRMVRGRS